jgi:hypothetical protein
MGVGVYRNLTHPQNVLKKREKVNMSDDLVKRLECYADLNDAVYHPWVYKKAADRIKKLEAALREIIQEDALTGKTVFVGDFGKIACKALAGKDDVHQE